MSGPLRLGGGLVHLRDFADDPRDVDDAGAIFGDDRVTRWLSFDPRDRPATEAIVRSAVASAAAVPRIEYYLAVTRPGRRQVLGFARLGLGGARAARLGYAIHADHQGNGYAADAARALVRYGFDLLGLHRITAAVGPENSASVRVLKSLGFSLEGRLRDHVFTNGGWRDSLLYSLLADDR